jgi:glutamate-ammonia-ligase adenylyltransferase
MRADEIAPREAAATRARIAARLGAASERPRDELVELGALIACSCPALERAIDAHPEDLVAIGRGLRQARDARTYRRLASAAVVDPSDGARVRRGLRRFAEREKLRVAARELAGYPGHDVDVTSRELSDLADVCCEVALAEAQAWAEARFGTPVVSSGEPCGFAVVGMGKLGGRELNAGSDIDLILFYDTDDGFVRPPTGSGGPAAGAPLHSLHEHFTRVAQRFVATLDEATEDGVAWRVDLRLRPEGTTGPLVNALAAAERYYETWGRPWERAALVRARAIAGDLAFGARLLEALAPFVWRKTVDPLVITDMASMLARARAEAGLAAGPDLKIGPGGIREVEFFTQGLQLVWGGREPGVRSTNTIEALYRLRARGFVTEREERELSDAYFFLRRLEHRVQFATGQQTHTPPSDPVLADRIARSLGYEGAAPLQRELAAVRNRVSARFASIVPANVPRPREDASLELLWAALDAQDEPAVAEAAAARFGAAASTDLPRHLLALARLPDRPLGAWTRDHHKEFAARLIQALADAADPEQAARLLTAFFARLAIPGVYVRAMIDDPHLVRAICSLLGASAFLGEAIVSHPDLVDRALFGRGPMTPDRARAQVDEEVAELSRADAANATDVDEFVGAIRRAVRRATFEIGLADLAGELGPFDVTQALTALADGALEHTVRFAMEERARDHSLSASLRLAVIALGSFGGREMGYGSDLDLFFVYDGAPDVASEQCARIAQRVLRLMETPHREGPGYSLDTRLRPSGNQGMLVVSVEGFARYQEERAESWERQALVKARACAGDAELNAQVIAVARRAAYERGAPDAARMQHLRNRMERELGHERLDRSPARYDLKVGRGGLADIEFATQWLQMRHGTDPRVRTPEVDGALSSLEAGGYLDPPTAELLREAWRFLRRLEQRLRISHGTSVSLLEEGAPGLWTLARRMGMRDGPRASADKLLLDRYTEVTREVRAAYLRVLGVG